MKKKLSFFKNISQNLLRARPSQLMKVLCASVAIATISSVPAQARFEYTPSSNSNDLDINHEAFELITFKFNDKGIEKKSLILLKRQSDIKRLHEYAAFEKAHALEANSFSWVRPKTTVTYTSASPVKVQNLRSVSNSNWLLKTTPVEKLEFNKYAASYTTSGNAAYLSAVQLP